MTHSIVIHPIVTVVKPYHDVPSHVVTVMTHSLITNIYYLLTSYRYPHHTTPRHTIHLPIHSLTTKVTCIVGGTDEDTLATTTNPGTGPGTSPGTGTGTGTGSGGGTSVDKSPTSLPQDSTHIMITALGVDNTEMGFVTKIIKGSIRDPTTTAILRVDTIDR